NGATTGAGVFVDDTKDFAALGAGAGADLCIRTVINPFTETCSQISAQPVGDTIAFTNNTPGDLDAYLGANCQATTAVAGENFVGVGNGTVNTNPGTLTLANGNVEFGSITVDWTDIGGPQTASMNPVNGQFGGGSGIDDAGTVVDYINGEITLTFEVGSEPVAASDVSFDYTVVNPDRCSYRVRMMREPFNGCRGGEEIASYDPLTHASPGALDNPGMGKSLSSFQTGAGNAGIVASDINAFKDSRLDLLLRAINDLADGRVNATDDNDAGGADLTLVSGGVNDYNLSYRLERLLNSLAKDDPNTGEQSLVKTLLFGTGGVQANEEGPVQALLNDDEARASLTATLALFGRLTTLPPNPVGGTNAESAFDRYPTFETTGTGGWPEVTAAAPCNLSAFPAGDPCDGNAIHDAIDYQFLALKGILDVLGDSDGQDDDYCDVFGRLGLPANTSTDTIQDGHCDDPDVLFFIVSQFKQLGLIKNLLPGIQVVLEATNATGNEPPLDGSNSCGTTPGDNSGSNIGFFRTGCEASLFTFRDLRSNRIRGHQTQLDRDALADIIQRTVFSGNGDYSILSCVDADADCDMNLEDPATSTVYPEAFAPIDRPSVLGGTDGVLEGANQVLIRGVYQALLEYQGEDTGAVVTANEIDDQVGYGTRRNRFVALEELLTRLAGTPGSFGDLSQALRIVRGIAVDKRNDEQSDARDTGAGILAGEFGDDPTMTDPEGNTQRDIGPILSVNAGLSSRGTISAGNPYQSALDIVGDFLFTLLRDPTDCNTATVSIERNAADPGQPLACAPRDAVGFAGNANYSEDADSVFRDVGVTQERPIQPILNEAVFESISALFAGDDQAIIVQALPFLGAFLNESIGPVLQRNGDFLEYDYCDTGAGACSLTEDTIADALLADLQTLIPDSDLPRLDPMLTDDMNRDGDTADTLAGYGTSSPLNDLDANAGCPVGPDTFTLSESDNVVVDCNQDNFDMVSTADDWGDSVIACPAAGAADIVANPLRCQDLNRVTSIGFTSTDGVVTVAQIDGLDAAFFDGLADLIANEDSTTVVNNQSNRTSTASEYDTFTFRNVDSTQAVDPNFINLLTSLGELLVQTNQ
ncbi:MAG: hypothetical protein KDH09_19350, partial [Chrysiogenetes bacterium]|nr:hypothetical protein [Chrysiogenetes bacterium]